MCLRLILLTSVLTFAGASMAQSWPAKPVTLLVSSAPGAGVDVFARILAERLRPRLEQTVVVENRPGASGMLAAGQAVKATPDGYTLFLMPNTLVIAPYVLSKGAATVNVITELAPVVMPVYTLMVLAVNGKFSAGSVNDLVGMAKKQPGLPYTGGDNGSPMHVLGEQFRKAAGLDLVHVPYKGVAQAVTAAIGGQVNVIWMPTSGNLRHFTGGALRVLATSSSKRTALLPDTPTMIELGYKDMDAVAWFGLLAPLATPVAIIARINKEVNAVLAMPEVRNGLTSTGYVPEGGTPEALSALMRTDDARYRKLVAELGVKAD
ncbi:MAG: tripartite tricarboxylate transporter substrate binding protein [Betaproteobacteria bacterium]|nr:tripartite tricarboxylate transporter substrate binding protein [Betaproteobacteria bacterium]